MNMRKNWYWVAPLAFLAMGLFAFLGGEIVKLLWNWIVPPLFGWHQIQFWQALGLLALCRILFGGHGMLGSGRSGMRRQMRQQMDERWEKMTPEERERARQRCGFSGFGDTPPAKPTV